MSEFELARSLTAPSSSHDVRERIADVAAILLSAALLLGLVSAMFGSAHFAGNLTTLVGAS
jgi:cytochrome c oxidase subunit IV